MNIKFIKDLAGLNYLIDNNAQINNAALGSAALWVVDYIKSNWSGSSPSSEYNPPAVVTGNLDAGIYAEGQGRSSSGTFATGANVQAWFIQVSAENSKGANYAEFLEFGTSKMAPRPFLSPALYAAETELGKFFSAAYSTRFY